jgi:hypothetical protein
MKTPPPITKHKRKEGGHKNTKNPSIIINHAVSLKNNIASSEEN